VNLEPIARTSLVDEVVERIRNLIAHGDLRAGDRLPSESELIKRLSVSRPVLRQAISRLETLGLLTVRRGRGMFVGDRCSLALCAQLVQSALAITPRDLANFTEFRRALECFTARRAAELATQDDVAELETLCEQMEHRVGQDYLEGIQADFRFHLKLVGITGNELMRSVMEVIQKFILAGMVQTVFELRYPPDSRALHLAIVEAIRRRDPDAAEQAMRRHMDTAERRLQHVQKKTEAQVPNRQTAG